MSDSPIRIRMPFDSVPRVTQWYGENPSYYEQFGVAGHNGVDFGLKVGVPLKAVDSGTVDRVQKLSTGYGWNVLLKHTWGSSIYAHMSNIGVGVGQQVEKGEVLGLSGNTGNSTGPHLHFGTKVSGQGVPEMNYWVDPAPLLGMTKLGESGMENATKVAIRNVLWNSMGIPYNPATAIAKFAKEKGLGAPKDGEQKITMGGKTYVVQPFDGGIVAVVEEDWANVELIPWN